VQGNPFDDYGFHDSTITSLKDSCKAKGKFRKYLSQI
jgi:hypothetical protein